MYEFSIYISLFNAVLLVFLLFQIKKIPAQDISLLLSKVAILQVLNEKIESSVRTEIGQNREESNRQASELRNEIQKRFSELGDTTGNRMTEVAKLLKDQLESFSTRLVGLTGSLEKQQEGLRVNLDSKMKELREENSKKLDEMRQTVDEKLQSTLEKRLGESFKHVSERLEQVHKGLGEMQNLAAGVGDLKRVLTNVKTRGGWGEVQLDNLLSEILTAEQYETNAQTKEHSSERVEFAIKLPRNVLLPIDSKFPQEDYERLLDAIEEGDSQKIETISKDLERRIKSFAKDISSKYINPPNTTDFAILYLPTEGLFAEVIRRPGLVNNLQRDFRIVVAGPTTITALLNSLQMGFKTLAIQKRSSEVWQVLAGVKTEFEKFGEALGKVKKKLSEASNQMDHIDTRTRQMERKLKTVEKLPESESVKLLELSEEENA
ncbi:MAG: DNA recombination protein RmuC [Alphaproteobacteria bacterium]|nr:DNA recombination protein RmuC [Alphaproteobacteria bacterium]